MAGSYAGAYGAGGAADALRQFLTDKLTREKFAEQQRHTKTEEEGQAAERRDTLTYRQQQADAEAARGESATQNRYEDRTDRRRMFDVEQQQHVNDQQVRAKERADDREAGLEGEDRAFGRQEKLLKERQAFERELARGRQGNDNEPLVSITDPTTGQPKLVPRHEAVGQRPASTREQALTEGQSNSAGFADRMTFNEQHIRKFDEQATSRGSQLASMILPNEMRSTGAQGYETAKKNWIAAILRKQSGAAISPSEYAEGNLQYFPQPGENQEIVQQKRQLRAIEEAAMRRASGSAQGGMDSGGAPAPASAAPAAPGAAGAPMMRTLQNARGEKRQQISTDGGKTWAWAN